MFMELCAEQKWVTYKMTPAQYARATNDFNDQLKRLDDLTIVLKHPRAIMDKLAEVEAIIAD